MPRDCGVFRSIHSKHESRQNAMSEQDERRKKNNKILFIFLAFFISILLTGVSADVDSLTCFFGLTCSPNPLTGNANITLKEGLIIDHTINTPYNLTLNLSNIPTDFKCTVQNDTAISTITKSSNLPSAANNAIDLGVQNVLMAQTAAAQQYSIRYLYLETV